MDFSLCPDHGPARLIRFVDHVGIGYLAKLDKQNNVLTIDQALWDLLDETERQRALTTHTSLEYTWIEGRVIITPSNHPIPQRDAA